MVGDGTLLLEAVAATGHETKSALPKNEEQRSREIASSGLRSGWIEMEIESRVSLDLPF